MRPTGNHAQEETAEDVVVGCLRGAENRRFLTRMPFFRADPDLPDELVDLLTQLDERERRTRRHASQGA